MINNNETHEVRSKNVRRPRRNAGLARRFATMRPNPSVVTTDYMGVLR